MIVWRGSFTTSSIHRSSVVMFGVLPALSSRRSLEPVGRQRGPLVLFQHDATEPRFHVFSLSGQDRLAMFRRLRHRVFSVLSSGSGNRPTRSTRSAIRRFHPHGNNPPRFDTLEDRVVLSAVFTVTNTADAGPGSLRQAILNANASNQPSLIDFRIPTSDPGFVDVDSDLPGGDAQPDAFVIRPSSPFPALSNPNHRVAIDGRTQTLFTCDTHSLGPEIVLDGSQAGATAGLRLVGAQHQVVGLGVQNFNGPGIVVDGADQTVIGHSVLGGAPGRGNAQEGVRLVGDADGNAIGGPIPWDEVKTNEHIDLTLNLAGDGWSPRVDDNDADTLTYGQRTLLYVDP